MAIQNQIIKWWVQNIYSKKIIKYEPGFIVSEYNNKYGNAFQRLVSIPEDIIVELEKQVIENYGDEGREVLKQIGREYGYNFAYTLGAPKISQKGEAFVKKYIEFAIQYGLSSWAKSAKIIELNFNPFKVSIQYDQHIVCRKNGIGIMLTEYTVLGFIEYIMEKSVKLLSSKCQGRGDPFCETTFDENIDELPNLYFNKHNFQIYKDRNSIKKLANTNQSMNDVFKRQTVKDNFFYYEKVPIITIECSLLFLIEKNINKNLNCSKLLFDIGFNQSNKFRIQNQKHYYLIDFFAGLGFGELFFKQKEDSNNIYYKNFPWSPLIENNLHFELLRGFISGLLSKIYFKNFNFKKTDYNINNNTFTIKFY
jgi:predicted hydrocarbon binding protein